MPLSELVPVLYRFDRQRDDDTLAAGTATLTLRPITRGSLARLETIVIGGGATALGGARVSLYVSEDAAGEPAEADLFATALLGATDPGVSFGGGDRPWLYGGEILTAVITGAGTGRVTMRAWQRLYQLDHRETDDPMPVRLIGAQAPQAAADRDAD